MIRLTLGYHLVISGYGLWLPGDERGSWSERWDDEIGYCEPHMLHEGDPVRQRIAEERMKHPPTRMTDDMIDIVIEALGECAAESTWKIAAASIESTHTHPLMTYSPRDIDETIKWLKQRMTKAIHQRTNHTGPVWAKGKWCSFIFDESHWRNAIAYVERHNIRRGMGARPYPFISAVTVA